MKILTCVLLAVVVPGFLVAPSSAGDEVDKNLTKQISDVLTECKKITVGMTRSDLLKVFSTEGGLSTAKHRIFVHRWCPYIKVDVDFTLSDPKQSVVDERPTDTVSRISKPYLDWSISD
jgi:hypothetical protein